MRRSIALVAIISVAGSLALHAQAPVVLGPPTSFSPAPAGITFHGGVDLVALTVTVTDPSQHFVRDLKAGDVAVLEDGVRQPVTFFATADVPLELALVIDTSTSMVEKLPIVRRAASGLVRSLKASDRAELVEFSDVVAVTRAMTADLASVVAGIATMKAEGNTGLYNALYVTLREFTRQTPGTEMRRKAIVLFSDGEDTSSVVSFDDVLDLAKRSGVAIYTIALGSPSDRSAIRRAAMTEADYDMRALAVQTGARSFFPTCLEDVRPIYDGIATELSSQYSIGYLPQRAARDGAWRQVVVQVTARPSAHARSRLGYYAATGAFALAALMKH